MNKIIYDSILKTIPKIDRYKNIVCFVSGGADSDIMIDLLSKVDTNKKIKYVFFNTGIEYEATKQHLDYLEDKYNINIEKIYSNIPVPLGCKKYGLPFMSKYISDMISRLQKHNFQWEDDTFENLIKKYPNCKGALKWWCNKNKNKTNGEPSSFNIEYIKKLKEFMIKNPIDFRVSPMCCKGAKKDCAKIYCDKNNINLSIIGVRKSEKGLRSTSYKSCFSDIDDNHCYAQYRPIFWYQKLDKLDYNKENNIVNSLCYSMYGLKRTGCAGCPFGQDFEKELDAIKKYEPKLYNAVNNIFGKSYAYARKFYEFKKKNDYKPNIRSNYERFKI